MEDGAVTQELTKVAVNITAAELFFLFFLRKNKKATYEL